MNDAGALQQAGQSPLPALHAAQRANVTITAELVEHRAIPIPISWCIALAHFVRDRGIDPPPQPESPDVSTMPRPTITSSMSTTAPMAATPRKARRATTTSRSRSTEASHMTTNYIRLAFGAAAVRSLLAGCDRLRRVAGSQRRAGRNSAAATERARPAPAEPSARAGRRRARTSPRRRRRRPPSHPRFRSRRSCQRTARSNPCSAATPSAKISVPVDLRYQLRWRGAAQPARDAAPGRGARAWPAAICR